MDFTTRWPRFLPDCVILSFLKIFTWELRLVQSLILKFDSFDVVNRDTFSSRLHLACPVFNFYIKFKWKTKEFKRISISSSKFCSFAVFKQWFQQSVCSEFSPIVSKARLSFKHTGQKKEQMQVIVAASLIKISQHWIIDQEVCVAWAKSGIKHTHEIGFEVDGWAIIGPRDNVTRARFSGSRQRWSDVQDWYDLDPCWHLERRYARARTPYCLLRSDNGPSKTSESLQQLDEHHRFNSNFVIHVQKVENVKTLFSNLAFYIFSGFATFHKKLRNLTTKKKSRLSIANL